MTLTVHKMFKAAGFENPIGERLANWLRPYQAKELARMFGVEARTAKNWRGGKYPQMRHLILMAERWGVAFLEDIFEPVLSETDISLSRRLERIEADARRLKQEMEIEENNGAHFGAATHQLGHASSVRSTVVARTLRKTGLILSFVAVMVSITVVRDDMRRVRPAPNGRTVAARVMRPGRGDA